MGDMVSDYKDSHSVKGATVVSGGRLEGESDMNMEQTKSDSSMSCGSARLAIVAAGASALPPISPIALWRAASCQASSMSLVSAGTITTSVTYMHVPYASIEALVTCTCWICKDCRTSDETINNIVPCLHLYTWQSSQP